MKDRETFRAGVGMVVINTEGLVLAIERRKNPGAWQLPQGGLEPGETPRDGAYRELEEETGIRREDVEFVDEHPVWLGYELPDAFRSKKTGRGQVHRWLLFRLRPGIGEIPLPDEGEARAARFMPFDELVERVVEFRRAVYAELARCFGSQTLSKERSP